MCCNIVINWKWSVLWFPISHSSCRSFVIDLQQSNLWPCDFIADRSSHRHRPTPGSHFLLTSFFSWTGIQFILCIVIRSVVFLRHKLKYIFVVIPFTKNYSTFACRRRKPVQSNHRTCPFNRSSSNICFFDSPVLLGQCEQWVPPLAGSLIPSWGQSN